MNTFFNLFWETKLSNPREMYEKYKVGSLHERINNRGAREQYATLLLTHYFPNENIEVRKCKGTFIRNNVFYSKFNA
jgi:hypothetical protein